MVRMLINFRLYICILLYNSLILSYIKLIILSVKQIFKSLYVFAHTNRTIVLLIVVLVGIILRYLVSLRGYNYDFESYTIVGEIVDRGGNVYLETFRYNYGPVWFYILGLFYKIAHIFHGDNITIFRYLIITFLTAVDIGIFLFILKKYGAFKSILFFLNPVSIIITGYHNQFDNFAILTALLSIDMLNNSKQNNFKALALLGFSLMIKHIFIFFPFWLFLKNDNFKDKMFALLTPILIFVISFLPFWSSGKDGIIHNVVLYASFANAPFWNGILPQVLQNIISYIPKAHFLLFIATVISSGFIFRKKNYLEMGLFYTTILVIFSYAIANQYLAIVIPFVAIYSNFFLHLFTLFSTWHLIVDPNGLHIGLAQRINPEKLFGYADYKLIITSLLLGLIWIFYKKEILFGINNFKNFVREEFKFQLLSLRKTD